MIKNLRIEYRNAPMYKKLIYINVAVFLVLALSNSFNNFFTGSKGIHPFIIDYFFAPAKLSDLVFRFWTIVSYMFSHVSLSHIFYNMLIFFIGGRIFMEVLGGKRLLNTYFLGGFSGLFAFVLAFAFLPYLNTGIEGATLHGASAAVIAVVTAVMIYSPNYVINLILLGPLKLKYLAGFLILASFLGLGGEVNRGGEVSHVGGIIWGAIYSYNLKKGRNIGSWFDRLLVSTQALFKPRSKIRVEYSAKKKPPRNDIDYNSVKKENQEVIDAILDKISRSGYDSLTKKEKEVLFKATGNK